MRATEKLNGIFDEAEQMLTHEIPFDSAKWKDMIRFLKNIYFYSNIKKTMFKVK